MRQLVTELMETQGYSEDLCEKVKSFNFDNLKELFKNLFRIEVRGRDINPHLDLIKNVSEFVEIGCEKLINKRLGLHANVVEACDNYKCNVNLNFRLEALTNRNTLIPKFPTETKPLDIANILVKAATATVNSNV